MSAGDLYLLAVPVWNPLPGRPVIWSPLVLIVAESLASPAKQVEPILDEPVHRLVADQFRVQVPCGEIADRLGGDLMGAHGIATLIGPGLPEERPELLALLGDMYIRGNPPADRSDFPDRGRTRRVVQRG